MNSDPKKDRRDGGRREARIKIRFASPEALQKEYAANISKGGMFINTRKPHPLRSKVKFNLILPVSNESIELTGEVVHVIEARPGMDPSMAGIGVQFIDLTREKRKIIENYISGIGKTDEDNEQEALPDKDEIAPQPEQPQILHEALRSASREFQELSPEQLIELKRKIKMFYAKRAGRNQYDLLGVRYTAKPEAVREAYHKLSMEFHPDRHHRRLPPKLRPQIEDIFGRINRAYKILRDINSRLDYDVSVGNWGSVPDVPELSEKAKRAYHKHKMYRKKFPEKVERAEQILEAAQAVLAAGDKRGAATQLKLAHSFDPFNQKVITMLEELGVKVSPPAEM